MYNGKMMGDIHERYCDCNCIYVSGVSEKCNRKHGVKRQRAKEKRNWRRNHGLS